MLKQRKSLSHPVFQEPFFMRARVFPKINIRVNIYRIYPTHELNPYTVSLHTLPFDSNLYAYISLFHALLLVSERKNEFVYLFVCFFTPFFFYSIRLLRAPFVSPTVTLLSNSSISSRNRVYWLFRYEILNLSTNVYVKNVNVCFDLHLTLSWIPDLLSDLIRTFQMKCYSFTNITSGISL